MGEWEPLTPNRGAFPPVNPRPMDPNEYPMLGQDRVKAGTVQGSELVGTTLDVPGRGITGIHIDAQGNFSIGGTHATDAGADVSYSVDFDLLLAGPLAVTFDTVTLQEGTVFECDASLIGFYGATPVLQQTKAGLTNNTGGSGDNTMQAVSGSGDDATINNNFTDLRNYVTRLHEALQTLGLVL